jgi:hypothetical protein
MNKMSKILLSISIFLLIVAVVEPFLFMKPQEKSEINFMSSSVVPNLSTVEPTEVIVSQQNTLVQIQNPRDIGTVDSKESTRQNYDDGILQNGYWWNYRWIPGLPTYESQLLVSPLLVRGSVVFYAPGIMEATAEFRRLPNWRDYVGTISSMTAGDIGAEVWLGYPVPPSGVYIWEGPFLVVDCARRNDLYGVIVNYGEIAEVDFKTAKRWGMVKYTGLRDDGSYTGWEAVNWSMDEVIASKIDPTTLTQEEINMRTVSLSSWFLDKVRFEDEPDIRRLVYITGTSNWRLGDELIILHPNKP